MVITAENIMAALLRKVWGVSVNRSDRKNKTFMKTYLLSQTSAKMVGTTSPANGTSGESSDAPLLQAPDLSSMRQHACQRI